MTVRSRAAASALIALAACGILAVTRASADRVATAAPPVDAHVVGPTGIVLPAVDPMASEMRLEIERSQREYAALFQRLSLAQAESEAFAIQEDMRQQRTGLQIGLLRIQAAYARRAGRNAFAAQLERAIEALIASDRPRPATDERHKL